MKKAEIRQFWWKKRRKWPKNEHFGASPKGPPEFPTHRVRLSLLGVILRPFYAVPTRKV